MEIIGASHSRADARQSSSGITSLRDVECSRIRPHPVQVRLQVLRAAPIAVPFANFSTPPELFPDNVAGNPGSQRKRKPHRLNRHQDSHAQCLSSPRHQLFRGAIA